MTHKRKEKRPKAIWVKTYPKQAKALRPENGAAGGVKARSQPEAVRQAVYLAIKELFITQNPLCQCCVVFGNAPVQWATELHHVRGRLGLLLFDVRYWKASCAYCHRFIHSNPEAAIKLGLLSKEWNRQ